MPGKNTLARSRVYTYTNWPGHTVLNARARCRHRLDMGVFADVGDLSCAQVEACGGARGSDVWMEEDGRGLVWK